MSITSASAAGTGTGTLRIRSERLRKRAAERGASSVAEMAALFGLSRQHVYQLLKGRYLPSMPTAQRIADALQMPVEDLFERV